MMGYVLMDLSVPSAPFLFFSVGDIISAYSAREAAGLEGDGGSKKRKTTGRKAPRKGLQIY